MLKKRAPRTMLLAAVAAGAAVLTPLALPGAAMAGTNAWVYTTDEHGRASWQHDGDALFVCDMTPDGYGTRAIVHSYNSSGGYWEYEMGVNDPSADRPYCERVTKNVPDGRKVQITVWLYKSGHPDKSHASVYGVA